LFLVILEGLLGSIPPLPRYVFMAWWIGPLQGLYLHRTG